MVMKQNIQPFILAQKQKQFINESVIDNLRYDYIKFTKIYQKKFWLNY